ncbi:uncharacterized protein LOC115214097 [Argonauta hians]
MDEETNSEESLSIQSQSIENEEECLPTPLDRKSSLKDTYKEIEDKFCDPNNPVVVTMESVIAAAFANRGGIIKTPCTKSQMSSSLGMNLYFKKEFLQITGSFKERGGRFSLLMLSPEEKKNGVIAASAGNHALALSCHGNDLGVNVTVVMPVIAPIMKIQACQHYNATVIVKGENIAESRMVALKLAKEHNYTYINGFDHPNILAGAGTMGLEIVEQVPDMDYCIIPIGGGGLIAGSAVAIKFLMPKCKIIGVESESCASYTEALKQGKPMFTTPTSTLADGLAVPIVGFNAFATAKDLVDEVITVSENYIALSILRLVEQEKAVVEGAGAVGLAALLSNKLEKLKGKTVVVALCGGNIDTPALGRVIERGLAADGRLIKFVVTVSDRPGGIADLTRLIASIGVSIKEIFHERAWLASNMFAVKVKIIAETKGPSHTKDLKELLALYYTEVTWGNNVT